MSKIPSSAGGEGLGNLLFTFSAGRRKGHEICLAGSGSGSMYMKDGSGGLSKSIDFAVEMRTSEAQALSAVDGVCVW